MNQVTRQEIIKFEVIKVKKSGRRIKKEKAQAEYFAEDLGNNLSLDLVLIPGGSFTMGSPKEHLKSYKFERPQHEVTIKQFCMGKYQVTQAQWQALMGYNPSDFKDSLQNPVEGVSWEDAVEFCEKLSEKTGKQYRLPSEAEWEYACRAETSTPFHFGETITGKLANYRASETYAEAGSFSSNAFGLYDMHGNVWEWCEDDWHDNYEGAPSDGRAWLSRKSTMKVMRGGSWCSPPHRCRSASRLGGDRGSRSFDIGFRVVCVAPRTT